MIIQPRSCCHCRCWKQWRNESGIYGECRAHPPGPGEINLNTEGKLCWPVTMKGMVK